MKSIIPIMTLLILIALGYWWLTASKQPPSIGLIVILSIDLLIIVGILVGRPFVFDGKDSNNIILYFIYLATAGALFAVPVTAIKDQLLKEEGISARSKQIIFSYLAYSALLLILIGFEALGLRGIFS